MSKLYAPRRLDFEILESRVLFSASLAPTPAPDGGTEAAAPPVQEQVAAPQDSEGQQNLEAAPPSNAPPPSESGEIVFDGSGSGGFDSGYDDVYLDGSRSGGNASIVDDVQLDDVERIGQAAAERWIESGLDADQIQRLSEISYSVVELQGNLLGTAQGNHISIDYNAAGTGWFVDPTPFYDEEFGARSNPSDLVGRYNGADSATDLLTVILHEQGHILGLDHLSSNPKNIMSGSVAAGERLLPLLGQAQGNTHSHDDHIQNAAAAGSGVILEDPAFPDQVYVGETATILGSFQNTTGNPVTVELLDENKNILDSVDVLIPNTNFSLSVTPTEPGPLKVTVYAYDQIDPLTSQDFINLEITVNSTSTGTNGNTPLPTPVPTPTVDPPIVTAPTTPVDPPTASPLPTETQPLVIDQPAIIAPAIVQPNFLDRFAGNADLSQQLFGPGGIYYIDLNQLVFSQLSEASQNSDLFTLDQDATDLYLFKLYLEGDLRLLASISAIENLKVNLQSLGLGRVDIGGVRGNPFVDYTAGSFLHASQLRIPGLPAPIASR